MEVDRLQPFLNIETRTGLLDPREVSVTENLGFGIVGTEALEKLYHGLLLGWGARVGWIAVGIETALVADSDAVGIVMLGMGSDFALRAAGVDDAVFRDVIVVADGAEASCLVAGFQGFYWEIPGYPCGGTMDYYHVYFSHNEFFFIIFSFLYNYNIFFSNHPVPLSKEGSTFSPSPSSSGSGDVAGDAIALPEFLYRQRSLCPQGAADDCLTQQSCDCLCGVNRLAGVTADGLNSLQRDLKWLGLWKFAGAVMYVLHEVFGLSENMMIAPMNEKEGAFLLDEIMRGGNFGQYDDRLGDKTGEGKVHRYFRMSLRNMRFIKHYPSEALCEPLFRTWFFFWKMWNK